MIPRPAIASNPLFPATLPQKYNRPSSSCSSLHDHKHMRPCISYASPECIPSKSLDILLNSPKAPSRKASRSWIPPQLHSTSPASPGEAVNYNHLDIQVLRKRESIRCSVVIREQDIGKQVSLLDNLNLLWLKWLRSRQL